MTESFGVFCKNCGSYEIDIKTNPDGEIVFDCKECAEREYYEGDSNE